MIEKVALVLNHSMASGTAKVVLLGIANHDGDGGAWPTIATLSKYARVSERAVQTAIRHLVEMGELEVVQNAGGNSQTREDRRPNLYRILVKSRDDASFTPVASRGDASFAPVASRGEEQRTHGVKEASPKPSLEPSVKRTTKRTPSSDAVASLDDVSKSAAFDEFWQAYPRKVGKGAARKAHAKAIKRASAPSILKAVFRQRKAMLAQEERFRPHPTTWLNRDGWEDEVAAPQRTQSQSVVDKWGVPL